MTTVSAWPTPIKVRLFGIEYVPDLDSPLGHIRFGVFGDFRMGDRYALGLTCRKTVEPDELRSVGLLSRKILERPFAALKTTYDRIWTSPDAAYEFNRLINAPHNSFQFVRSTRDVLIEDRPAAGEQTETVKSWCLGKLRPILREEMASWLSGEKADDASESVVECKIAA